MIELVLGVGALALTMRLAGANRRTEGGRGGWSADSIWVERESVESVE